MAVVLVCGPYGENVELVADLIEVGASSLDPRPVLKWTMGNAVKAQLRSGSSLGSRISQAMSAGQVISQEDLLELFAQALAGLRPDHLLVCCVSAKHAQVFEEVTRQKGIKFLGVLVVLPSLEQLLDKEQDRDERAKITLHYSSFVEQLVHVTRYFGPSRMKSFSPSPEETAACKAAVEGDRLFRKWREDESRRKLVRTTVLVSVIVSGACAFVWWWSRNKGNEGK